MKDVDAAYYTAYGDLTIHSLMLQDETRVRKYQDAIESQPELFKGKVVIDVGAGLGILSLFCARAGARKVYAVEASTTASGMLAKIVQANNYENIIEILYKKVEDVTLSDEFRADILVSEWMGFYLLHESMLDSVIFARNNLLKPGGLMFPYKAELLISLGSCADIWHRIIGWTHNYMNFDFTPLENELKGSVLASPIVESIDSLQCNTCEPVVVLDLDLRTLLQSDLFDIRKAFTLSVTNHNVVHCFVLHFDVLFPVVTASEKKVLSTSPHSAKTHWKQALVFFPSPLQAEKNLQLSCFFQMKKDAMNWRRYEITVEVEDARVCTEPAV